MSDFGRISGVLAQALHQIYVSEGVDEVAGGKRWWG